VSQVSPTFYKPLLPFSLLYLISLLLPPGPPARKGFLKKRNIYRATDALRHFSRFSPAYKSAQTPVIPIDPLNKKRFSEKCPKLPSLERLLVLFEYDPISGTLFHKISGEPAGSPNKRGYLYVRVDGGKYPVHNIAWCLYYNKAPRRGVRVFHRNGMPSDNTIDNLKLKRKLLSCAP
jgi:hypothetical protein